jgi:hypothetical protein
MKNIFSALIVSVLFCSSTVHAQSPFQYETEYRVFAPAEDPTTAFREKILVPTQSILVPTVVSLSLPQSEYIQDQVLVQSVSEGAFIGSVTLNTTEVTTTPLTIQTDDKTPASLRALTDTNSDSFSQFEVIGETVNEVTFYITSSKPISTSALRLALAPHVALPLTVAIKTGVDGTLRTIIAEKRMDGELVRFPEITTDTFVVTLTYGQPLRIEELSFIETSQTISNTQSLRFLAQPNESYVIYLNSDRAVQVPRTETGNLQNNEDVRILPLLYPLSNEAYAPADVDYDGIPDRFDNCVTSENSDQIDINDNGRGDACEDFDRDGISNPDDNCPSDPNQYQSDEDGDGLGDACDTEESRFTEQNPWIPWIGMGTAAVVILTLFVLVATTRRTPIVPPAPTDRT